MSSRGNSSPTTTVLLCGVGGQGTILAADLLAHAAMSAGYDVKLSEIHGMAQRGGAVTTIVRFGKKVSSMVTDLGAADHIVAFETTEALRNLPFLKEGGTLIVSDEEIRPLPVLTGQVSMPTSVDERLQMKGAFLIPAVELAAQAGSRKSTNVVLLGALSNKLDIDTDLWVRRIEERVPKKTVEANKEAFFAGAKYK